MGLKQDAVLANIDGNCEMSGVIVPLSPNAAIMTTVAYGVQISTQRATLVRATLAIFISALSFAYAETDIHM